MRILLITVLFFSSISFSSSLSAKDYKCDIVVYGNSSAAVTAAVQAAKAGKNVVFVSSDPAIGGLTASGLGATDINRYQAVGGLSKEFYQRIYQYYDNPSKWTTQDKDAYFASIVKRVYSGRNVKERMQWVFEPHVALKVFEDMLSETGVKEIVFARLQERKGVERKKGRINKIRLTNEDSYTADVFIDASYEGDLMAQAGVSYTVGREANSVYGETMNGILPNSSIQRYKGHVDPYVVEGDPKSGLLPFIEKSVPGNRGEGDKRIQAYCYRLCLTNNPTNRIAITKPQGYNPLWYEYIARIMRDNPKAILKDFITITPMPNMKSDINHADFVGANYNWPEASYKEREKLKDMHRTYALGLVWFLSNDPRVPQKFRDEMGKWGLPKDEFTDNGGFPYQPYIREARRMVSDYVMTEKEVTGAMKAPNSVGLGTYWFDSHVVSRYVDANGSLRNEGTFWGKQAIYPISYQSIVPRKKECRNLIVPVCLSASHAAYGSIRMEPVYMILGQSAATAAVIASDKKIAVQDVDYRELRAHLTSQGQLLKWIKQPKTKK